MVNQKKIHRAAFAAPFAAAAFLFVVPAACAQTPVTLTTANGTVSGTGITFLVTDTGGTARSVFGAGQTSGGSFSYTSFPEFVATGVQTLTVTFSSPVPINRIVLGVNSLNGPSGGTATLSLAGGDAVLSDFDIAETPSNVGAQGPASFNPASGTFTPGGADRSLLLGSTAQTTFSSFTLTANGGGDGYTLFFGTTQPAGGNAAPEPGSILLLGMGLAGGNGCVVVRRRKPRK